MLVRPGAAYRLKLTVMNARGLSHHWLIGAMAAKYPRASIVGFESYSPTAAVLIIRWDGKAQDVRIGTQLVPVAEGLQVPGEVIPLAVVDDIEPVGTTAEPTRLVQASNQLKLAGAGAILLAVFFLTRRIKRHVPRTAE